MIDVINVLKDDENLSRLLAATKADSKIYPFFTTKVTDCVYYSFSNVSYDGVKKQDKLDITIISKNISKATLILDRVKELLITIGDKQFNNRVLKISLNGGGSLYNEETQTYHFKAYFIINRR